jgi:L-threonylcarbamoyladenylate synthase
MRVIDLRQNDKIALKEAVLCLCSGGTIVYPTETAYGLGGNFLDKKVRAKIFKLKQRPKNKALPVIVGDLKQAQKIVKFDALSLTLAKKYWPSPLTLILPVIDQKLCGCKTLAIRVSSFPWARNLAKILGKPLISTSANLSGAKTNYSLGSIVKSFKNQSAQPDLLFNSGRLPKYPPSTIVKITKGKISIIRQGSVKITK